MPSAFFVPTFVPNTTSLCAQFRKAKRKKPYSIRLLEVVATGLEPVTPSM